MPNKIVNNGRCSLVRTLDVTQTKAAPKNIIVHSRRSNRKRCPPTTACQTLVAKDGNSSSTIASVKPTVAASKLTETVGNPNPMTPFTMPASRNTNITIETDSTVIMLTELYMTQAD